MYFLNVFLLSFTWFESMEASVYPAVVWDHMNPLFGCDEPKINIRIGDIVNFVCPSDEFNFFESSSQLKLTYENLYYLGSNKEQFQTCNATGMKKILYCDGGNTNMYTITFRDIQTSQDSLKFTKGETYYFIGTGFRSITNLNQTVGGSCNNGENKLRLKIYICKDNEKDCDTCKTAGCYYKDCGNLTCQPWASDGKIYKNSSQLCSEFQKRTCKNDFVGYNDEQVRNKEVTCPPKKINCSTWFPGGNLQYDTKSHTCFSLDIRTCKNGFTGEEFNETRNINNTCPDNLSSCSNWTTNIFSQKCIKLSTRKCGIPLAGEFKESNYTEVQCPLETTSMVVPVDNIVSTVATSLLSNGIQTTMVMQADDISIINSTSFHVASTTSINFHSASMISTSYYHSASAIPTSSNSGNAIPTSSNSGNAIPTSSNSGNAIPTSSNSGNAIPTSSHIPNKDTNDTNQFHCSRRCNDDHNTTVGLIAAIGIIFICFCIVLCYCVFKLCNRDKRVKIHPNKIGIPNLTFKLIEYNQRIDGNWRLACVDDIHGAVNENGNLSCSEKIKDLLSGENLRSCALENGRIYILSDNGGDKVEVYKGDGRKLAVSTVCNSLPTATYINKGFSSDIA